MSTCISKHGEYSEHGSLTDGYRCECCGALDEAAMRKDIEAAVREQVAQDIEGMPTRGPGNGAIHPLSMRARAARIARGEQ